MSGLLHNPTSPQGLAIARIWIYSMCLGDLVRERTAELVGLPLHYFHRIGVLELLPEKVFAGLYDTEVLLGFKIVVAIGLIACILGLRPFRLFAVPTSLLLVAHQSVALSAGHINHGELMMLYAACVLAWAPCTDAYSLGRRPPVRRDSAAFTAPMVLISFLFLLSYTFTGVHRLAQSGVAIFFDDSIVRYVVKVGYQPGEYGSSAALQWVALPVVQVALRLGFAYVTVMEVLSPLSLFSKAFRRLWIVSMLAFHFSTLVLMQLFFFHNVVMMPLVMLDWQPIFDRWRSHLSR